MQFFQFSNQGNMIRYFEAFGYYADHWFLKRDIISIDACNAADLLKIVVKNKPPLYFPFDSVMAPDALNLAELAFMLNGWITDDICCGNYPPSGEPPNDD